VNFHRLIHVGSFVKKNINACVQQTKQISERSVIFLLRLVSTLKSS